MRRCRGCAGVVQELWYRSAEVQRCGGCEDVLGRCRGSAVKGDSAGDCAGVEVVQSSEVVQSAEVVQEWSCSNTEVQLQRCSCRGEDVLSRCKG
jgi:hypothetical protein